MPSGWEDKDAFGVRSLLSLFLITGARVEAAHSGFEFCQLLISEDFVCVMVYIWLIYLFSNDNLRLIISYLYRPEYIMDVYKLKTLHKRRV